MVLSGKQPAMPPVRNEEPCKKEGLSLFETDVARLSHLVMVRVHPHTTARGMRPLLSESGYSAAACCGGWRWVSTPRSILHRLEYFSLERSNYDDDVE